MPVSDGVLKGQCSSGWDEALSDVVKKILSAQDVPGAEGPPVGDGRPGPVTERLREMYWDWHKKREFLTPIDYDATVTPLAAES